MSASDLATVAAFAALGFGAGIAFFSALRINVGLYATSGVGARAVGLHLLRLGAVGVVLWVAATLGAGPLLAAAAGFLVARLTALRRAEPGP